MFNIPDFLSTLQSIRATNYRSIVLAGQNSQIINRSYVPKHFLEISNESPYASIYENLAGTYALTFRFPDDFEENLKFTILPTNFKIVPLTENVYYEKDGLDLLNKGSVVHFSFDFAGIIAFDHVDIYFKTHYLREGSDVQDDVFSDVDNENRLVNGDVAIDFSKR